MRNATEIVEILYSTGIEVPSEATSFGINPEGKLSFATEKGEVVEIDLTEQQKEVLKNQNLLFSGTSGSLLEGLEFYFPNDNPDAVQIVAMRKASGLTQAKAAKLIHTRTKIWQDWEKGISKMHPGLFELFMSKAEVDHEKYKVLVNRQMRIR